MSRTTTPRTARRLLAGAATGMVAGAAGTTALNAATYLDMVVRGRPASGTPEDTVVELASRSGVGVPGDREHRAHRVSGLGPLLGIATGVGVGAAAGVVHAGGLRMPFPAAALLTSAAAMVAANGPMSAVGISDPRGWSGADWAADALPHLAYGVVTKLTIRIMWRD